MEAPRRGARRPHRARYPGPIVASPSRRPRRVVQPNAIYPGFVTIQSQLDRVVQFRMQLQLGLLEEQFAESARLEAAFRENPRRLGMPRNPAKLALR